MAHVFEGDFSKLESEDRKKSMPPDEILKTIGVKHGDTFVDFGCGIGYFAIPALEFVGSSGRVIAIDISKRMIDELNRRIGTNKNMEIILGDNIQGFFEGFSADIIFICNVLHEIDFPNKFMQRCYDLLRNNGKVVVIDWQKIDEPKGPPKEHRISKEEVINIGKIIFSAYKENKINPSYYFLEFHKK